MASGQCRARWSKSAAATRNGGGGCRDLRQRMGVRRPTAAARASISSALDIVNSHTAARSRRLPMNQPYYRRPGIYPWPATRPVPSHTRQLVVISIAPVPRHCSHTAMLVRSCASGGRRVSQSSREPLPRHAEQMTESLTTPDPLHTVHVSSVTPILLAPQCASSWPPVGILPDRLLRHLAAQRITCRACCVLHNAPPGPLASRGSGMSAGGE
jgi:hypothetical protein